jgi:aminomethyltransferase
MIGVLGHGRCRLRLSGADRVAFLHGQCTNDIKRLQPGQSCYAAFLNAKGKMRGDAYIVCLDDAFLLDASAGLRESLEKFIVTEDVTIEDVSGEWGSYLLVGRPTSHGDGSALAEVSGPAMPPGAITFTHPLGTGVWSREPLPVTLDAGALEVLRIEAGIPKWGVDMDENTIPIEAGLEKRAIRYEKGCYIGQETIARIKTYGHVNRHLVQLSAPGDPLPAAGEKINARPSTTPAAVEVGHVTSAARSNRLGKVLALGYVRREFASAGAQLMIGQQPAEVSRICGA